MPPRNALVLVVPMLALVTWAASSAAADPACDRVRAEASAEAALLYAPRVELEGARAPGVPSASDPSDRADGLQARVAVALSPIDMLRGRAVERVADAECVRDAVAQDIERVLAVGPRAGELEAVDAELAFLAAEAPGIEAMVVEAVDRLAHGRATALEVDELRHRQRMLTHRTADLRHTRIILVELVGAAPARASLPRLAAAYQVAALAVDHRRGATRALSAWRVEVRGGAAASDQLDWFVVAEVGVSLGRPWQRAAERRLVRAHARELRDDDRSPVARLARLRRTLAESAAALAAEVVALDAELAERAADQARLEGLDGDAARTLRARASFDRIELQARRIGLAALATSHRSLAGDPP